MDTKVFVLQHGRYRQKVTRFKASIFDRVHPLAPARHDEQSLKIADLAQSSNDLMNDYEGRTLYILKVTDSLLWLLWQQA